MSVELLEKLGRNDPCPCDSGKRFQGLLPQNRPVSTEPNGATTGGEGETPHLAGLGWWEFEVIARVTVTPATRTGTCNCVSPSNTAIRLDADWV